MISHLSEQMLQMVSGIFPKIDIRAVLKVKISPQNPVSILPHLFNPHLLTLVSSVHSVFISYLNTLSGPKVQLNTKGTGH